MTGILQASDWAPGAKQWSGPYTGGPAKGLLHATIAGSMALPDYAGQSMAPHETLLWNPQLKVLRPYQHYRFDQFAKALRNTPGGVETNRDGVRQWELAGFLGANGAVVPKGGFDILTAPDIYWEQVANHIGPVIQSWGIKNVIYPTSAGRMSLSQWDNFSGLCTHADTPENDHWDLPIPDEAVTILAKKLWYQPATSKPPVVAPVPNTPTAPLFPFGKYHYFGQPSRDVHCHSGYWSATDRNYIRMFQKQLKVRGWTIDVDGLYGSGTKAVVSTFQTRKHVNALKLGCVDTATWRAIWESK